MMECAVSPPPCVSTAILIVFRPLRPTGHEGDVRFSMKEMCSFISFKRRRAFRRRRDDRGRLEIHRETRRLALLRETTRLALLRETRRLALLRETTRLALLRETRRLALLRETRRLALFRAFPAGDGAAVTEAGGRRSTRAFSAGVGCTCAEEDCGGAGVWTAAAPACGLRRRRRVDCGGAGVNAPRRTAAAPACSVAARAQPLPRPGRLGGAAAAGDRT
jgi:hypothetical protein